MQTTAPKQINGPVIPIEVHKLYRPVEFKLTTIYDASKTNRNPQVKYLGDAIENNSQENTNQTQITVQWREIFKVGPGLSNAGNTCFLNAVLQMLTYTSPFANYLLERKHSIKCPRISNSQFCALCAFEEHIHKYFKNNAKAIKPQDILRNIKLINKKFQIGRQEDAQEFLRDLVEAFQKSCTGFLEKPPQKVLESTDITKIFGGKLKSSIECKKCHYKSDITESFFDLNLEISKGDSLEKCLDGFFRAEELTGQNKYKCSNCKRNAEATKKFSIQQRPIVLTIHLKRFENVQSKISKITRQINFRETLSLKSYMAEQTSEALVYDLQGIIVHVGAACESGHYYSCIKNSNGIWHQFDDESVKTSKVDNILKQEAYILTYVLRDDSKKTTDGQKDEAKASLNVSNENNLQQGQSSQLETKKANALIDEIFGKPSKGSKSTKMVVEESKFTLPEENKNEPIISTLPQNEEIQEAIIPAPVVVKEKKSKKPVSNEKPASEPLPMEVEKSAEKPLITFKELSSLVRLSRRKLFIPVLKTSPFVKLKRMAAATISSVPVKKLKTEEKEVPVKTNTVDQNESFDHQADQQEENKDDLVNVEAIKKKEKKEYQPLIVGKNIFLTKKGGMKKGDHTLQGWDAPGNIDDDRDEEEEEEEENEDEEFRNMVEERKRIMSENQDFFLTRKKEKDQYDKEYDKGRLKKVKKNKNKQKFSNNFQKAYEFISRRRRR